MKLVQQTDVKKCNTCGEEKPYSDYYKYARNKDGFMHICKVCHSEKGKDLHLLRKFGITRDEYNDLYNEQNGSCACCGKHQVELNVTMAVDHCHETGRVRGLLCGPCNRGIGMLGDNIEGLRKALKYLEDAE